MVRKSTTESRSYSEPLPATIETDTSEPSGIRIRFSRFEPFFSYLFLINLFVNFVTWVKFQLLKSFSSRFDTISLSHFRPHLPAAVYFSISPAKEEEPQQLSG